MKKYRKLIIGLIVVAAIIFFVVYRAFFDIQHIDGQNQIAESVSPDGKYTVTAYVNDGGATTGYAVLCTVENNKTGRERNIYWQYCCEEAEMQWKDNRTIVINSVQLDVKKDSYDWRND